MKTQDLLLPDWPAPPGIQAFTSTRRGGVSQAPFATLNLGQHVGDDPHCVAENRRRLAAYANWQHEPGWLKQVHGCGIVDLHGVIDTEADASISRRLGQPCVVMTADCLPVLFAAIDGSEVAASHAGWRGLAAGVLEATVARMQTAPERVMAWLGPAIGPHAFEVGDEVRAAFVQAGSVYARAFQKNVRGRWYCDLFSLARLKLAAVGVTAVYGGGLCTYSDRERFYSYRRDGVTGRMGSFIWIEASGSMD